MAGLLLDTNHLSAAIRPVSEVRERLFAAYLRGEKVGTCIPVLCELEVGIRQLKHAEEYRRTLLYLLRWVRIWPIETDVIPIYADIRMELRSIGRALSQIDVLLAAMARSGKRTILTADRDFDALPDLRVENWIQ